MGLKAELLRGIYAYGFVSFPIDQLPILTPPSLSFERPSAIQQRAIIPVLKVCLIGAYIFYEPHLFLLFRPAMSSLKYVREAACGEFFSSIGC